MALFSKEIASYLSSKEGSDSIGVYEPPGETFLDKVLDLYDAISIERA